MALARAVNDAYRAQRDAASRHVELMIKSGVAAKLLALHEEQARAAASAKGDHQARCGDHRSRHRHRRASTALMAIMPYVHPAPAPVVNVTVQPVVSPPDCREGSQPPPPP